MNPDVWGPHAWTFLHAVAHAYPDDPTETDKEHYTNLFLSLRYTLPCPTCQEHFRTVIQKYPIRLDSRRDLEEWVVDIHNEVNRNLGQDEYTYHEAKQHLLFIAPSISASLLAIVKLIITLILSSLIR